MQSKNRVSETRIRKAAEELVQYFHGAGTSQQASMAGEDMREWQLGSQRVDRRGKAQDKDMLRNTARKAAIRRARYTY